MAEKVARDIERHCIARRGFRVGWCCELAVHVVETNCLVLVLNAGCRVPVLVLVLRAGCARGGDRLLVLVLVPGAGTGAGAGRRC